MGFPFAEIRLHKQTQVMQFLALAQVCFTAVFIASCQKHVYCKAGGYHSGVYERFQSYVMWHHFNWYAVTTVLEELAASIFKVTVVKRECTKSNNGCSNLLHSTGTHSSTNAVSYSRRFESSHIHWLYKHNSKYLWVSQPQKQNTPGYCLMNPEELPKYCHDNEGSSW